MGEIKNYCVVRKVDMTLQLSVSLRRERVKGREEDKRRGKKRGGLREDRREAGEERRGGRRKKERVKADRRREENEGDYSSSPSTGASIL